MLPPSDEDFDGDSDDEDEEDEAASDRMLMRGSRRRRRNRRRSGLLRHNLPASEPRGLFPRHVTNKCFCARSCFCCTDRWLSTIQHDLRCHNHTLPEAVAMAQNCSLWRLQSMSGATGTSCMPEMTTTTTTDRSIVMFIV